MLRRFLVAKNNNHSIRSRNALQTKVATIRLCSTTTTPIASDAPSSSALQEKQQQQQQKIPEVLQQFDQHMRTNPEFRKLYPKLLKAIVTKSQDDIVKVAGQMTKTLSNEPKNNNNDNDDQQKEPKSSEKKQETATAIPKQLVAALNLIVVDVAFADMFFNASTAAVESNNQDAVDPMEQEESDEQLLELLLSYFGEDFKKQKARIGKFVIRALHEERDKLMEEKGRVVISGGKQSSKRNSSAKRSAAATLPNFAVTVTPPIDAENEITANDLLSQIKHEVSLLAEQFEGDKQRIVTSVLKRRVFSGAVKSPSSTTTITTENKSDDETELEQVERITCALFEKQKKKAVGNVEFDPDIAMMMCRIAVEQDMVDGKNTQNNQNNNTNDNNNDETSTTKSSLSSASNLLRFDIGVEESTFANAIGLDLFFDFEKDGDKAVNEMDEALSEICKRVSQRLNSGFRGDDDDADVESGVFKEEAILPFAFTMRCKILMK